MSARKSKMHKVRRGYRRVKAAVVVAGRKARKLTAAVAKKVRHSVRRGRRNPVGFLSIPAVRIGAVAVLGVGIGVAVDGMKRPDWMPEGIPVSVVVGALSAAASYRFLTGDQRQYGIAASVGCAIAGGVPKVAEFAGDLFGEASGSAPTVTKSSMRRVQYRPLAIGMSSPDYSSYRGNPVNQAALATTMGRHNLMN